MVTFFLVGLCKNIVYLTTIRNVIDLRHRITEATAAVAVDVLLPRIWPEMARRLYVLRATNGALIEVY